MIFRNDKTVTTKTKIATPIMLRDIRDLPLQPAELVQPCLSFCHPSGCIPSDVIAQVPAKVTAYSTSKERSFLPLNKGLDVNQQHLC